MSEVIATNQTILVVGGGISGATAAIEAAECGKQVILVEKNPSIGGRVSQLYKYFPKLCFPSCGMEINLRRMKANRNLAVLTMTEVAAVSGKAGNYRVTLKTRPRYVNAHCTACGACEQAVEAEFPDEYNYGMKTRKGAYLPFNMAYPQRFVLDPRIIGTPDADKARESCKYEAIDLDMQESEATLTVGAIVWATGWQPYDADKIQPYGHDRFANVVSSVEFERMLDPLGIDGESYENPKYLDKLVETMGAEPVENYDKKVSCCGGALAFSEPEKSQALIKDVIESAYDGGADMIVTPCPVCQMNVEVYQNHINQKYKTNFKMPVVYYSTLMSVAYGKNGKEAGLDGQMIKARQLEEIASK